MPSFDEICMCHGIEMSHISKSVLPVQVQASAEVKFIDLQIMSEEGKVCVYLFASVETKLLSILQLAVR